jgi:uncharacterized protein
VSASTPLVERDGPFEFYYENGQLFSKGTFVAGEQHGPTEWYYENGQLQLKGTYVAGEEWHGPMEIYDENGQLKAGGTFNMGHKCGVWLESGKTVTYDPCPPGN